MKVIIAGSRSIDWHSFTQMWALLPEEIPKLISEVVSGGARGPDLHGETVAKHNDIPIKRFIPSWNTLGKKAGILRNVDMGGVCRCSDSLLGWRVKRLYAHV